MILFSKPINWMENERDEYHLAAGGNDAGAQGVEVSNTKKVTKNCFHIQILKKT